MTPKDMLLGDVERATLVEIVQDRAATFPDAIALRYLASGDVSGPLIELSYRDLLRRSCAIGAAFQHNHADGDRALLVFPPGLEFVTAFFGCLFAGVIPVPVYPPELAQHERTFSKLHAIVADSGARFALTASQYLPTLERMLPAGMQCISTDTISTDLEASWQMPAISSETVALVQYTSGSTGAPKGVVVRHRQLIANGRSIESRFGPVKLIVGWLPVFHDMGLIGNVLQGLCCGSGLVLMSPVAFLKRPARWLEAISHYRATTSGGPNFAYDLCVRRVTEEERARLDLSSWEVAFCGAEPIREATYRRFCSAFESCGFSRSSFYPCYGLAEATLFVAGAARGTIPKTPAFRSAALDRGEVVVAGVDGGEARSLMSCGKPASSEEVRIVDSECLTSTDRIGEIWVRGPAVASGYWGREAESGAVFGARLATGEGPFLRTGDLGFLHEGELYVAGRIKDVIILAGRNIFPQDIEATVEAAVPSVRKGCCVAFSVDRDSGEKLVIMIEHDGSSAVEVVRTIKRAVVEHHQASVFEVVLVGKGAILKTSSGKLERYACRQAYLGRKSICTPRSKSAIAS